MDAPARPTGGPAPGTDPAALRVITAVVAAGLVLAGLVAARGGFAAAGRGAAARAGGGGVRSAAGARSGTALSATRAPAAQTAAMRLLLRAAYACRQTRYQGAQLLAWWGPGGEASTTAMVDVWHQPGQQILAMAVSTPPGWPHEVLRAVPGATPADPSPALAGNGGLNLSQQLVSLLARNYRLAVAGQGQVAGRPARIITVRRSGGGLAARIWLDEATSLPLRRQLFDPSERIVSDDAFTALRLGPAAVAPVPSSSARPWGDTLAGSQLAALRAHGWPLPGPLLGKLSLVSASETVGPSGPVVALGYSDGLCEISVFVQRGHLPAELEGWRQSVVDGHRVFVNDPDDLSLAWSAQGFVYTVLAVAPQQLVGTVVGALPHDAGPGILARLKRGLRRLLSWASP